MTVMGPDGAMHVQPQLPVQAMKTFTAVSPQRDATCEEAGCEAHARGWRTIVPAESPQAAYIRSDRTRRHTEAPLDGGLAEFTFEPGQRCFARHRLPWEGRERFAERGGDWRGTTSPLVAHSPQGWLDAFGEHQQRLAERLARG